MGAQPLRFSHALPHDEPPLDPEREEIIRDRLESGFYHRPEVLLKTAERLYADLLRGDPFTDADEPAAPDQRER